MFLKELHVRMPDELYAKLRARAGEVEISMNELVNNYIWSRIDDNSYHKGLIHIRNAKRVKS